MLKVLDRKSACVFWQISEAELDKALSRGILKKNPYGDIYWETRHAAWKKLLDAQSKRISDLEFPRHRYGMKRIKTIGKWGIYQYKPSVINAGNGDTMTYVYSFSSYLEKVFATYDEAEAFALSNVPFPDPLITTAFVKSYARGLRVTYKLKKQQVLDWAKEELASEEMQEEMTEYLDRDKEVSNFRKEKKNFMFSLLEVEETVRILAAHREEMGYGARRVATRFLTYVLSAGHGADLVKDIYALTPSQRFSKGGNSSGEDDTASVSGSSSDFRYGAVKALIEAREKAALVPPQVVEPKKRGRKKKNPVPATVSE